MRLKMRSHIIMNCTKVEETSMETKKNALSVDDICSIIKLCSSSGVSEIEFGSLKVSFQDRKKLVEPIVIPSTFHGHESNQTEITEEPTSEDAVALEADLKALEMQNLVLEDPSLAETLEAMDDDQIEEFMERISKEGEKVNA